MSRAHPMLRASSNRAFSSITTATCFITTDRAGSQITGFYIGAMQRAREATLVCVSFAPPRTGADMQRCVRILTEFYDAGSPFSLALGGHAAAEADFSSMDTPFTALGTFVSVKDFHESLITGFGIPGGVA